MSLLSIKLLYAPIFFSVIGIRPNISLWWWWWWWWYSSV